MYERVAPAIAHSAPRVTANGVTPADFAGSPLPSRIRTR